MKVLFAIYWRSSVSHYQPFWYTGNISKSPYSSLPLLKMCIMMWPVYWLGKCINFPFLHGILSRSKQYSFIISQFCRSEFWVGSIGFSLCGFTSLKSWYQPGSDLIWSLESSFQLMWPWKNKFSQLSIFAYQWGLTQILEATYLLAMWLLQSQSDTMSPSQALDLSDSFCLWPLSMTRIKGLIWLIQAHLDNTPILRSTDLRL